MTALAEPACQELTAGSDVPDSIGAPRLRVEQRPFDSVDPATWDALAARNPWSTPFARWAFHRAWWDAYGGSAHDQTLVVLDETAGADAQPIAIVPLMHRHEVEPTDAEQRTTMRHAPGSAMTAVEPHAKAVFFGASYHADYATLLAAPDDLPAVADALVDHLADPAAGAPRPRMPWDVVDMRRLRCGDPAAEALAEAFDRRE